MTQAAKPSAPASYLHPRGLPKSAIYFDTWKNYAPKYKTVTSATLTPGRHTQHIQSIGREAQTWKITALFDEWHDAPSGSGGNFTGANAAWQWLSAWLGDGGTDVDNVFVLKAFGGPREVVIDDAEITPDSVQTDESGYVLRFEVTFSGKFYSETFIDPAMFNKRRSGSQARKRAKLQRLGGVQLRPNGDFVAPGTPAFRFAPTIGPGEIEAGELDEPLGPRGEVVSLLNRLKAPR